MGALRDDLWKGARLSGKSSKQSVAGKIGSQNEAEKLTPPGQAARFSVSRGRPTRPFPTGGLHRLFRLPVLQVEELFDLAPLVTVLQRFLGLVVELSEGVFGVTKRFDDRIQGLTHCIFHDSLHVL